MSIFEFIGGSFIIFTSCVGIYTIGRLVVIGLKSATGDLEIGGLHSNSAVQEYLKRIIDEPSEDRR